MIRMSFIQRQVPLPEYLFENDNENVNEGADEDDNGNDENGKSYLQVGPLA